MEKLGTNRRSFSLTRRPPILYTTAFRAKAGEVEVFEPYEENLPLEAGFYTFVLDEEGRFRIRRGNTSSHAGFVKCGPVGAAGHFQINRAGNVSEVFCISLDYRIFVRQGSHPTATFVMDSFRNHHALELSPLAIFRFKRDTYGTYFLSLDGQPITDPAGRQELLVREGEGPVVERPFSDEERRAFAEYRPTPPPQRYAMHLDQQVLNLESDDAEGFEVGPGVLPYSPDSPALTSGRKAFVIDREGWVIIGNGHHILSGGNEVGAAGQIIVEPSGMIGQINLNFSGHYRPPLDATYARYTYRVLVSHPLLTLSPDCVITGRKFDDLDIHSSNLKFSAEELLSDDPELDELIEYAML